MARSRSSACSVLIAYLPQIVKIARDTTGAKAISNTTWMLFAVSHLATALYAIAALQDAVIGVVFIANAACCLVIAGLVVRSRIAFSRRTSRIQLDGSIKGSGSERVRRQSSSLRA